MANPFTKQAKQKPWAENNITRTRWIGSKCHRMIYPLLLFYFIFSGFYQEQYSVFDCSSFWNLTSLKIIKLVSDYLNSTQF